MLVVGVADVIGEDKEIGGSEKEPCVVVVVIMVLVEGLTEAAEAAGAAEVGDGSETFFHLSALRRCIRSVYPASRFLSAFMGPCPSPFLCFFMARKPK